MEVVTLFSEIGSCFG